MRTILFSIFVSVASVTSLSAASINAIGSYYTFGPNVSSNTTRLLADKAPAIGFPTLATVSFLLFDRGQFPSEKIDASRNRAYLKLEHDPVALVGTLLPAEASRPVIVKAFAVNAPWDNAAGNLSGIEYGQGGSNAIDTAVIGDPGVYRWDITSLLNSWIESGTSETSIALSGVFGNADVDGRNSYAAMHAVTSTEGLVPHIEIGLVPLPSGLTLFLSGFFGLGAVKLRKHFNSKISPTAH